MHIKAIITKHTIAVSIAGEQSHNLVHTYTLSIREKVFEGCTIVLQSADSAKDYSEK